MHSTQWRITLQVVVYTVDMRTTITMDEETAKVAAQYARSRGVSLSKAISELVQRGLRPRAPHKVREWMAGVGSPEAERAAYN